MCEYCYSNFKFMQRVYSSSEFPRFPGLFLPSLLTLAYRTVSSGWQRSNYLSSYVSMKPGIVNRTQSHSIHGLGSIECDNRTKSNTELCVSSISEPIELNRTNPTQSNSIHYSALDGVGLSSETELNRAQLNRLRLLVIQ